MKEKKERAINRDYFQKQKKEQETQDANFEQMAKKNSIFKQHSIIGKKGMMKNQTHSPTYIVRFLSPRSDTSENQENNDNNQNYINNKQG